MRSRFSFRKHARQNETEHCTGYCAVRTRTSLDLVHRLEGGADIMETTGVLKRLWQACGIAILFTVLAALLRLTLPGVLQETPFLIFYPAVALSAVLGGFVPGMVATLGACLCYILWFDPTPRIFDFTDLIRLSIFVVGGGVVSFLAYAQHRREEALGKSEERSRQIALCVPDMIWIADFSGRFIYANAAVARTHGYTLDEFLKLSYPDVCTPEQAAKNVAMIAEEIANAAGSGLDRNRVRRYESQEVRKDGSMFVAEVSATFLWSNDNKPVGIIGTTRDVTERKRADAVLRESEERYRTFFELGAVGMAQANPVTGQLLRVNDRLCEITGYTREELCAMTVRHLTHPDDRQSDWDKFSAMVRGETPEYDNEKRYVRKNGDVIWVRVAARVLRDASGAPLRTVAVILDITERKRAEEAIKALNLTLEERVAERTALAEHRAAQLRELASRLSQTEQQERRRVAHILHEHFQQLLFGAELQLTRLKGERSEKELARIADEIARILAAGIEASRTLAVELCPPILYQAGLVPALEWLGRRMREQYGLRVEVTLDPAAVPGTEAVRILLFESASELLFNIVKHAKVEAAHIGITRLGDQIELTISDKGRGFDPSQQPAEGSSSFGLFSIRERLEFMGGKLTIESAPGLGTRCSIVMPIGKTEPMVELAAVAATMPEVAAPRDVRGGDHSRKIRIILVDDHAIVRNGIALALKREPDMEIAGEAPDGQTAVELARKMVPDVVLMDVSMPGMDGIEATRLIHKELPDVSIIGLSMFEESEQSAAIRRAGACAYMTKSGNIDSMLATIRALGPLGNR